METIKTTKYLRFDSYSVSGKKTKTVSVVNIHHNKEIGVIQWYSAWRQYCFIPEYNTIWNKECLGDINEVIYSLMEGRRLTLAKPKQKTVGVISLRTEDFLLWRKSKRHVPQDGKENTQRRYVYKNKRYICLSRMTDMCGCHFDEVIETDSAYLNQEYDKIIEGTKPALRKGGKFLGRKF